MKFPLRTLRSYAFHHLVLRFNDLADAMPGPLVSDREQIRALVAAVRFVPLDEHTLALDVETAQWFNVDASGEQVRSGSAPERALPALLYGHRRNALLAMLLARKFGLDATAAPAADKPRPAGAGAAPVKSLPLPAVAPSAA